MAINASVPDDIIENLSSPSSGNVDIVNQGETVEILNKQRCEACQIRERECIVTPGKDACLLCLDTERPCIFEQLNQVRGPAAQLSCGSLLGQQELLGAAIDSSMISDVYVIMNKHDKCSIQNRTNAYRFRTRLLTYRDHRANKFGPSRKTLDMKSDEDSRRSDLKQILLPSSSETEGSVPTHVFDIESKGKSPKRVPTEAEKHATTAMRNTGGMYEELPRLYPYRGPVRPKIVCPRCDINPAGYRGEHELRRHMGRAHVLVQTKWQCVDISPGGDFLTNCKACKEGKLYGAYYNAAAHLRRVHFHPKTGGRKGPRRPWERLRELKSIPMETCKMWMREVEVENDIKQDEPECESDAQDDGHDDEAQTVSQSANPSRYFRTYPSFGRLNPAPTDL